MRRTFEVCQFDRGVLLRYGGIDDGRWREITTWRTDFCSDGSKLMRGEDWNRNGACTGYFEWRIEIQLVWFV